MEIKDLCGAHEQLDQVRGGVGDVNVYLDDYSQVNPSQNVTIGGGKKSQTILTNSPVSATQQVDASRSFALDMPISEEFYSSTVVGIEGSAFSFGGWRR